VVDAAGTRRREPLRGAGASVGAGRDARLDERYGRRPPSPRRRLAALAAVAALVVAGLAWVVWAGTGLAQREQVTHQVVGFSAPTDTEVTLVFQVTKDPGATVRCDVRALAEDFTTVGWQTVDIGPAARDVVQREVPIRTQQLAVSAEVMGCELVGS